MNFFNIIREWFRRWYTDGERIARHAVEEDARRLGGVVLWNNRRERDMVRNGNSRAFHTCHHCGSICEIRVDNTSWPEN